jgi:hypothetical protein
MLPPVTSPNTSKICKSVGSLLRELASVLLAVSLLAISGCVIVPTRLPTQTRDTSGQSRKIDLTFLKPGVTTREEVGKTLASIDAQVDRADLFWGRWESSTWGYGGFVALPGAGGAGGARVWGSQNLLVSFDQKGLVKSWVVVDDKKLDQQLDALDASSSVPLDFSFPVHAKVHVPFYHDNKPVPAIADLVLSAESLECDNVQGSLPEITADLCKLKTTRTNVVKMTSVPRVTDFGCVWLTIHFATPTPVGHYYYSKKPRLEKSLMLGVDPPTFLLLRSYMRHTT